MKNNSVIFSVLLVGVLLLFLFNCKKEVMKVAPTVTIAEATNVTANSATVGSTITADGGTEVLSRGVCWNINGNPTISDTKTSDGKGMGSFSSSLTSLSPGTTYNLKSYATNAIGTAYSSQISVTTPALAPVLTTTAASAILSTTATSGGIISSNGGAAVTVSGVCWGTSTSPTTALSTKTTNGSLTGTFTGSITGLTPGTTYYVRAYATNSIGTGYGNEITVTTTAVIPVLTTTAASAILSTTATSGGIISSNGGAAVTVSGVCWGTSTNPTTALSTKTTNGSLTGTFTGSITGLIPGTIYYVRAYATNSIGTGYGNEITVTTTAVIPVLTTTAASAILSTTATSGGIISSNGGAAVTVSGVCWGTSTSPTTTLSTKTTNGSLTGTFTGSITGLTPGTIYYVRAYATNSAGTAYGNEVNFTTTYTYTVVLSSNPAAGGTTSGGGTFNSGASVTVNAVANAGYTFTNWTVSGTAVSTTASYTFTISGNRTLVANFTPRYTVAVLSNPAAGGTTSGSGVFNSGVSVTVTAVANAGYTFTNWTESGTAVSTAASYTFTISGNSTLIANYAATYTVALSSNPAAGGTTSGSGVFNSGASVTVTAVANAGYTFFNWTDGVTVASTSATYQLTMAGNKTLVANFTPKYVVTVLSNPLLGGTTTGSGTFNSGASVTVTAVVNAGYTFINWTENGTAVSTTASYTFTISGNSTLVANYAATYYSVALSSNPLAGGTTSGSGLFISGASVTVNAVANAGYTFTNWTEGITVVSTNANYLFTISRIRTLVANFTPRYTVAVSSLPILGGTTSGGGTFNSGASVTVNAVANAGYTFTNWTKDGTAVSTTASYTFTISGNSTLIANYTIPQIINTSQSLVSNDATSGDVVFNVVVTFDMPIKLARLNIKYHICTETGSWDENLLSVTTNTYSYNTWYNWKNAGCSTDVTETLIAYTEAGEPTNSVIVVLKKPLTYTLAVSSNPLAGGITTGSGTFNSGASVTVTAVANACYTFTNWTKNGTAVSTTASYTFTISGNSTLVANYTPTPSTGDLNVTDADGNIYSTVTIGTQVWLASNLKTTKYKDGTAIPLITDNAAWSNLYTPGYCWYNNDATTNKSTYGALYNWYTVNTGKLCPACWHVPSDAEWTVLTTYLGGESVAGGKLKETGTSHWYSTYKVTNETGFTALPGGYRYYTYGTFDHIGVVGYWWSSTDTSGPVAWYRTMRGMDSLVQRGNYSTENGFSVRCVRDF